MIRFTRLTLCSGQTGTFMMIVEQLGLAMMPDVLVDLLGIDLRHHQRNAVLHAEGAGVVDDDRARRHRRRGEFLADRPAGRKEGDLHAP